MSQSDPQSPSPTTTAEKPDFQKLHEDAYHAHDGSPTLYGVDDTERARLDAQCAERGCAEKIEAYKARAQADLNAQGSPGPVASTGKHLLHTLPLLELDVPDQDGDIFTTACAEQIIASFTVSKTAIPVTISVGNRMVPHLVGFVRDFRIRKGGMSIIDVLDVDLETDSVGDRLIQKGAEASAAGAAVRMYKRDGDGCKVIDEMRLVGVGLTMNKVRRRTAKDSNPNAVQRIRNALRRI